MGANPKRTERWAIPRSTRHVWVLRDQRWEVPWQGYIVAWRRQSYRWSALVAYVDDSQPDNPLVHRWVPRERLVPVRSIPEDLMNNPFTRMLWDRRGGQ